MTGVRMDTMILLLYLHSGTDVTLDGVRLRGAVPIPFGYAAACQGEGAWRRLAQLCSKR